jgi:hypothetical protein
MAKKQNKSVTTIEAAVLDTYFKERMYQIGITNTAEHFFIVEGDHPMPDYKQPIFAETEAGNIVINYPCLYGGAEPVANTENPFTRLRYAPANQPAANVKYFQEKGTGVHIFHPPAIVKKFQAKEHIDTLIITEGEFKAYTGSLAGLDIIGLGGKDSFRDQDKNLHPDIAAIIRDCQVTNVLLLLDADTLQIKWDPENEPEKDLSKGLYGFFTTAINFRECTKAEPLGLRDVFFGHLKLDNLKPVDEKPGPKGLDDLIYQKRITDPGSVAFVTGDLDRLSGAKVYFDIFNLGTASPKTIRAHFWLNFHKGVPSVFYSNNAQLLANHEFIFAGPTFQMQPETGLEVVKHEDTDKFVRVECDYYKMIEIPDPNGILQPSLIAWKAAEINRDYGKWFFAKIPRFDAFCNLPNNTPNFEKHPFGCYNLYYPLTHVLEEGKWPVIEAFLKHCFGEAILPSGYTNYDLILDYITILYKYPTQPLPIGVVFSTERNTGKSTMLWLLESLFLANYTEITNDILEDHLNDDWATKLVIALDEGFIDKNKVLQKLKSLSTAHKIKLRGMYAGRKPVPFFGKFWLSTNDRNFIKLEKEETRFWINEVPVLKSIDPDILRKMQDEVPYFLYSIATREILHPKVSRHWFAPELLVTDIGNQVKENSKGWFERELITIMTNKFFHYKYHTLYFTHEEVELMFRDKAVKFRSDDIRAQLKQHFGMEAKLGRYKQPTEPIDILNASQTFETKHKRCYTFKIEDFVSESVVKEELHEYMNYDAIVSMRPGQKHTEDSKNDDLPF